MKLETTVLFICATLACSVTARANTVYLPSGDLLGSPALLQDYVSWDHDYTAFTAPGSEPQAYNDLVDIAYDNEIGRPWGDQYFPEAESRLETFRTRVCSGLSSPKPRICSVPAKMASGNDVYDLMLSLSDPALIQTLEKRWGFRIAKITLPKKNRSFNIEVGHINLTQTVSSVSYWNLKPTTLTWSSMIPVLTDADNYLEGFEGNDVPTQFALFKDGILLDDWMIRNRAMTFAHSWKIQIGMNQAIPPTSTVVDSEAVLYQTLFQENQNRFQTVYNELLPKVQNNAEAKARFLKERAKGDYPEEVYQYVAYDLLSDLVHTESAYYEMAATQRRQTSDRYKAFEALLTIQKYSSSWRTFLLEMETLTAPFTSHAAVLDQIADLSTGTAYTFEQIKAILGLDNYANQDYFKRFGYALLTDDLFNADYLKQAQPEIYKELLLPNGKLKRIEDLKEQDQIKILRQYVISPDGKDKLFPISRMASAFRVRIHEADLRALADIVHQAHAGDFR